MIIIVMGIFNKNNQFHFLYFFFIVILISEAGKPHKRIVRSHLSHHHHDHHQQKHVSSHTVRNEKSGTKAQQMCTTYTKQACSVRTPPRHFEISRITQGRNATAREYPHMALLGSSGNSDIQWSCGGSLISNNFVLSAGHCVDTNPILIRLGELDWTSTKDDAAPVDYKITKSFVHPHYDGATLNNDIALFKFQGVSAFNDYIRPICLNVNENIPKQKYIAVGWGAAHYYGDNVPLLQSVELDRQNDKICYKIYNESQYNARTMLCVGYAPGGKDSCTGDSGGPLQIMNKKAPCSKVPIYTQIGIISGGEDCALPNTPAKYTKVSYFVPWIESIVWN